MMANGKRSQETTGGGITVKYIYSACVVTTTPDIRILHDPWFSEGVYDGSWFHFPKVADPMNSIGDVDFIYISHIHPDHYDSDFLKKYFRKYGVKKVLIANHLPNYLSRKMQAEGITATILGEELTIGSTTINIVPHKTGGNSDIDSAIIIKYESIGKTHCVVNANDIIFDDSMRERLKALSGDVDILLCGYTGAGPYPQTYFDVDDPQLTLEAEKKKQVFFERYKLLVASMNARVNIPFAGKYVLGGRLSYLNNYRGVADPVEVLKFDPSAVVLADDGGEIDTIDFVPNNIRTENYSEKEFEERITEVSSMKMDFERLLSQKEIYQLPLKRLLLMASRNAIKHSGCEEDYFFCIQLPEHEYAVINANKNSGTPTFFTEDKKSLPQPRSEITIDPRYLFGLLTYIYHWNNAEVGSQYSTRRVPNVLNRKAQAFLNFLVV